ncbi:tyrosine-type recombinase/integrase (plasmid) [Escherichia albertii]|uniref:tyrosine-type recombinase/integrase n=1 Tax=Escherichia albertii TaxID=208962 RepID=UPI0023618942|nr:tyrosine-type recombinase/integrase [Escherichia albertii]MCZ8880692.1 tyrosine-type recombinase/integrase [Escherichia albertii]MCZ9212500.1 tyrosine-type recombinase/integrase [Escherichia albertii]WDB90890.1 tyrosine-type recombinase/integrase [Escherichia albertii]
MQHLPAPIHHARDAAQLPVAIDYPAALALRQMSMVHDELPKYLLAPEVSALLHYVPDLRRKMLLATLKIPMERRNKRTGRTEKARIWEVTDRTVRTWIGEAVAAAAADGVTFSVPVTPHTFRHSYAMHMLYAGIPLKVLQSLMGHKSISSTEVYTKVFALDVAARHRVQFLMPESDAVTMLKNRHA